MPKVSPATLTDAARRLARGLTEPSARLLLRLGLHPDTVTLLGLGVVLAGCVAIASGQLLLGGLLLLAGVPIDAVDGTMARLMQRRDQFGAVLDSATDRYADGFIFGALSYYFAVRGQMDMLLIAQVALIGTFSVSYLRARAEGVGVDVKIGLFTRFERTLVILAVLFVPSLLEVGVLILAIGTNFTALQRFWFVYQALKETSE